MCEIFNSHTAPFFSLFTPNPQEFYSFEYVVKGHGETSLKASPYYSVLSVTSVKYSIPFISYVVKGFPCEKWNFGF